MFVSIDLTRNDPGRIGGGKPRETDLTLVPD
jgi:hypothetical protein